MLKISVITPTIRPKGLAIVQKSLSKQTFKGFEWLVEVGIPERGHDLSKALNRALRRAKGEWIIMLQDYIRIEPDALEQFLKIADKKKLYTGAVGKTQDWIDIKWDWRVFGEMKKVNHLHWEADWAFGPLQAFKDVGGYDEEYDDFWSFDNVEIAFRMEMAGYELWVCPDNKAVQFDHDKVMKHPFRDNYDANYHNANLQDLRMGKKHFKLNYL